VTSKECNTLTELMNSYRLEALKLQTQALAPQTDKATHDCLMCESMALLRAYHRAKDALEGINRQSADIHY